MARSGRSLYLSIALGLLLGGALGNLVDRLRLGYVVDFIDIGHRRPALLHLQPGDSAITCSILLLIAAAHLPGPDRGSGDRSADG